MRIDVPFPGYEAIEGLEIPDANLMGVFSPRAQATTEEQAIVRAGFEHVIGAPRLREAVKATDEVLILVDDATRKTPVARVLPTVLGELHAASPREGIFGGAKIAFPGVAGREMMERNQWEASMQMAVTVMGVAENPMRLRMEEAATSGSPRRGPTRGAWRSARAGR